MRNQSDETRRLIELRRYADYCSLYSRQDRRLFTVCQCHAAASSGWPESGAQIMTYMKPNFRHPELPVNELGYTKKNYEGSMSTLCAGCGHDSISAAIVQACFELSIEPHKVAKMS